MDEFNFADKAVELAMCPRCEARPRQRCITVSGRPTKDGPHAPRMVALWEAYRAGWEENEAQLRREAEAVSGGA